MGAIKVTPAQRAALMNNGIFELSEDDSGWRLIVENLSDDNELTLPIGREWELVDALKRLSNHVDSIVADTPTERAAVRRDAATLGRLFAAAHDALGVRRGPRIGCDCCDHPLQHAIREVIARYEAPIPPPTLASIIHNLRAALDDFGESAVGSTE